MKMQDSSISLTGAARDNLWPDHLLLIGCGNMAGQMLARWIACGLDPARVTVLRPSGLPVAEGVRVIREYPDTVPHGSLVLLGIKPQHLTEVAPSLAPLCSPGMTICSILAGTRIDDLARHFPAAGGIVRAMPNLPVGLGKGVTALCAAHSTPGAAMTELLCGHLGLVEWLEEDQFNAVTALSGCGPAFVFRFTHALALAAQRLGIAPDQAMRIAIATLDGAAAVATLEADDLTVLADRVASKGGMTRAGLDILDRDGRLLALLGDTLEAARDRGDALARGE